MRGRWRGARAAQFKSSDPAQASYAEHIFGAEGGHIDDSQIHRTIEPPLADAYRLWEQQASGEHSEADRRRHAELTEAPDTCWDRLRQRRARREAGLEPGAAPMRDESVVESYEQYG